MSTAAPGGGLMSEKVRGSPSGSVAVIGKASRMPGWAVIGGIGLITGAWLAKGVGREASLRTATVCFSLSLARLSLAGLSLTAPSLASVVYDSCLSRGGLEFAMVGLLVVKGFGHQATMPRIRV